MQKNRSASLPVFVLLVAAIFAFTSTAAAQTKNQKKPAKKTAVSKSGKPAPKLKPGVTGKAKKAEPDKKPVDTAVKTEAKEKAADTATGQAGSKQNPSAPNPKVQPPKTKEKAASAKTQPKEKPAPKVWSPKPKAKPADATAAKPEPKEKAAPAQKVWSPKPKTKPADAAAVKKPETESKTSGVSAEKSKPKKPAAAKKPETESKTAGVSAESSKPKKPAVDSPPPSIPVPPVTEDKIRADITGRTIAGIPSEEAGDGTADWLFARNQPKEIEILKSQRTGDELTVEARLSVRKAKPNFDGSYDRVRGVARLNYARAGRRWELKSFDNVSLYHGDTGLDDPLQKPVLNSPDLTTARTSTPPIEIVGAGAAIDIAAGEYRSYSFQVANRAVVTGRFQARGGRQNDIETYILDYDGFLNWTNGHGASAYYNSGRLTTGSIEAPLSAGTYYLVFNNRYSRADDKLVEASIQLRTDHGLLPGAAGAGVYNGAGAGTVNTVRRVYAPYTIPAPSYIPPDETRAQKIEPPPVQKPDPPAAKNKISGLGGYASETLLSDTFEVNERRHYAIPFTVNPGGGVVRGRFSVMGNGDIQAYIMTAAEYNRWANYREGVLDYSSGRVNGGRINKNLNPGSYYLVFSNHFSSGGNKTVEADVFIEYGVR